MSSIYAQAMAGDSPPRVRVDWQVENDGDVRIFALHSGQSVPVRGAEPIREVLAGTSGAVYDYECPFGIPVRYLIVAGGGSRAVSPAVVLNPSAFYPNDQDWSTDRGAVWLRHLSIPQLSLPIDLANAESPVFKQARSVVDVLNRRSPIVVSDGRRKQLTSTLDIRTWSEEESARIREILADNSVLLLSVPAGERWGITHWYVAVGDVTEERLWQEWAPFEGRVFHLPVEVVDRPVGGTVYPDCSYWSEQRNTSSYFDLNEKHHTYAAMTSCDVTSGPPPSTGVYGLMRYTSPLETQVAGAVRGPDWYQPLNWTGYTFQVPPGGDTYKFVAQYSVQSSQAPMQFWLLLGQGPALPLLADVGPLSYSLADDPIGTLTQLRVVINYPVSLTAGTWSVSYAINSDQTWIEGGTLDPTDPAANDGVWIYQRGYPLDPGTPDPSSF